MKLDITIEMVNVINSWRDDSSCLEWRIDSIKEVIQWLLDEKDLRVFPPNEVLSKVRKLMMIVEELEYFKLKDDEK